MPPTASPASSAPARRGARSLSDATMANALRALAMDMVEQANSGHPGAPMGMADMALALWTRHLRHDPAAPAWPGRDRFVLSNGHASALLYALLHLSGYDLPLAELKNFRQLHSKTPGHPEHGLTPGVETTTGPLGQGITNAVGMALAEKLLAAEFNRPGHALVDHRTYVFMGDGCLMEGISHEACALAGAWRLDKLVALYDDNGISIDGQVVPWFADDTAARFRAYQWNVIGPIDGHSADAVDAALAEAGRGGRPTLVICKTHIGYGAPNRQDTAKAHGEPLGASEMALARAALGWPYAPFEIPHDVRAAWDTRARGAECRAEWQRRFDAYARAHPRLAADFMRRMEGRLPQNFAQVAVDAAVSALQKGESVASRKASQLALEAFTAALPELIGGSADLTGSNLTNTSFTTPLRLDGQGNVVLPAPAAGEAASDATRAARIARVAGAVGKEDEPSRGAPGARAKALPEVDHMAATPANLASGAATANATEDAGAAIAAATEDDGAAVAAVGARFHINYGVREFGMAAIMNGIALHGGYIPYGGTFLTFSDYSRNAIRMAALMKQRVVHVFTHDSIGLGEDGPTHQSIEHAASLRLIPGLDVWRPADTAETTIAWAVALQSRDRPTALLLSRQSLPYLPRRELGDISRGAYVLAEPAAAGGKQRPDAVILATGSEVQLALKAQALLAAQGIAARVVSMPCTSAFDRQDVAYKRRVLPDGVPRIAVEMGVTDYWWKYGCAAVVGIDSFGESAPAAALLAHFGFTPENVADTVRAALSRTA